MKKIWLSLMLMISLLGCSAKPIDDGKIHLVVSFYILEDFTQKIGGDHVVITNLMKSAGEPHDYEPSTQDMKILSETKYIMILGNNFETWFSDVYDTIKGSGVKVLTVSEGIPTITDAATGQIDPHIWTSIKNAKLMLEKIRDFLVEIDPNHQAVYDAALSAAMDDFDQLDHDYESALKERKRNEFVTNHAAFSYLAKDYGLTMIPIMGLEPDAEPSASIMVRIIDTVSLYQIPYILYEDEANTAVALTIARQTGAQTGILRTIESLNAAQIKAGDDYLSLMRENLIWLKKAVN
jgi:zinc transport system substrate-binding protein